LNLELKKIRRTSMSIGRALKKILEEKNLSYQDLANKTGISKPYIAKIVKENLTPSKEKIELVSKALEIEPTYFIEYVKIILNEVIDKKPDFLYEFLFHYKFYNKELIDGLRDLKITYQLRSKIAYNKKLGKKEIEIIRRIESFLTDITYDENLILLEKAKEIFDSVDLETLTQEDIKLINTILRRISESPKK